MPRAALEATIARNSARVTEETGLQVPPEWLEMAWLAEMRLAQLTEDANYAPWAIRAIAKREDAAMVGFLNCHSTPKNGRIELGYEIFSGYRRSGYAFEAVSAILHWSNRLGVVEAVFSISPSNDASLALNNKFGAKKIGSQIDEKDGLEDIYLLRLDNLREKTS